MEKKYLKVAELRNMYQSQKLFEEYSDTWKTECSFVDETDYLLALFANQSDYTDYDAFARHFEWSTYHYGKWGRIGVEHPTIHDYDLISRFDMWDYVTEKDQFLKDVKKASRNLDAYVDGHGNWVSVSDFPSKQAFRRFFIRELLKNTDYVYIYECTPSQFS